MKKLTSLILLLSIFTVGYCQELVVAGFTYDPTDQTALLPETEQFDQNGERCALIKVETKAKGFSFDVGMMGVTKVEEQHAGEIWVYVPHDVRRITIQHELLGTPSMPTSNINPFWSVSTLISAHSSLFWS